MTVIQFINMFYGSVSAFKCLWQRLDLSLSVSVCVACTGEQREAYGGRGADVFPTRHQPPDFGDAAYIQPRQTSHL